MSPHALLSIVTNTTLPDAEVDPAIRQCLGLTPDETAYAIREPDGRVMVWRSEADSVKDDGARAIYRSPTPWTDDAWDALMLCLCIDGETI